MKYLVLLSLLSTAFAGLIQAPVALQKTLVNTGQSSQYRSQDSIGNYAFGYNEEHHEGGSFRHEEGNALGQVVGSYGLRGADGRVRIVNYVADDDGFRANINTNEPGVEPKDPASATINKQATVVTQVAAPTVVAPAASVLATPVVQQALVAAAPVVAASKTVVAAPVQQVVEQVPIQQVVEERPIVQQQYVPPVEVVEQRPVVQQVLQQPLVAAPVVRASVRPYYNAPIVQQVVEQRPLVQRYEAPIVQQHVQPIVQQHVQPIVQQHVQPIVQQQAAPIVQQHVESAAIVEQRPIVQARYDAPLPVVRSAPIYQSQVQAPIYQAQVQYQQPIAVANPVPVAVGGVKGGIVAARPSFASPATLVKGNSVPVVIGQNDNTVLELVDTYAHPASFGYSLGMPSTWGYTYVVRRRKK